MSFRFLRQIRWAGVIVQFVGLGVPNIPLFVIGTFVFFGTYLYSLSTMEQMYVELEKAADAEEEKSETKKESEEDPKDS